MSDTAMSWSFYGLWNASLEQRAERAMTSRQKIWASELGGSMIDRYLKMKGTKPTNPPNARSLRKFEAGNIWESIMKYVLQRAGLLLESQGWVGYNYPDLLQVSGKFDFLAGGNPDFQTAFDVIEKEFSWLPETIKRGTINIIKGLQEQYGMTELKKIALEMKSCSSFMFDVYERSGQANPNHRLQLFHYLKAKDYEEGHVVYICKDDCRMLEIGVFNPSETEQEYKRDIEKITYHVLNNVRPPNEPFIVFDADFGRFSANWKVAYSNYLTMLYGFKAQIDFDEQYKPIAERWNRVLGRVVNGDKMTEKNIAAIDEIKTAGFDWNTVVKMGEKRKKVLEPKDVESEVKDEKSKDQESKEVL